MPQHEGFPIGHEQTITVPEAVFFDDGSLNEAFLADRFGIGDQEAMQEVTFGSYTGTVAQMLSDEKCPVGGMVSSAYAERGIEGVDGMFKILSEMDSRFSVRVTDATMQRELEKKK
jgi:hypothetical protein